LDRVKIVDADFNKLVQEENNGIKILGLANAQILLSGTATSVF
jgi:hypothetical protein